MRLPRNVLLPFIALTLAAGAACGGGDDATEPADTSSSSNDSSSSAGTPTSTTAKSSPAAAAAGELNACDIVTLADAAKVLGSDVKAAESSSSRDKADCQYLSTSSSVPDNVYIQVGASRAEKDAFELAKTIYKDIKPISGLGDDAFYIELGAPVVQVHVLKGGKYLVIAVLDISPADRVADATALAKVAAARL